MVSRHWYYTNITQIFYVPQESGSDGGLDQGGLRKALEWELSLDSRDLRSHAWYHGAIPRARADEIIERDGDFLVRDCASQPGNYVLSTRCKSQALHFVINKVCSHTIHPITQL